MGAQQGWSGSIAETNAEEERGGGGVVGNCCHSSAAENAPLRFGCTASNMIPFPLFYRYIAAGKMNPFNKVSSKLLCVLPTLRRGGLGSRPGPTKGALVPFDSQYVGLGDSNDPSTMLLAALSEGRVQ